MGMKEAARIHDALDADLTGLSHGGAELYGGGKPFGPVGFGPERAEAVRRVESFFAGDCADVVDRADRGQLGSYLRATGVPAEQIPSHAEALALDAERRSLERLLGLLPASMAERVRRALADRRP